MPYSLQGHMHEKEVTHQLAVPGGVRFVPHVAPWFRGISLTATAQLRSDANVGALSTEAVVQRYQKYFNNEPLVKVSASIPEGLLFVGVRVCWLCCLLVCSLFCCAVREVQHKPHARIGGVSYDAATRSLGTLSFLSSSLASFLCSSRLCPVQWCALRWTTC